MASPPGGAPEGSEFLGMWTLIPGSCVYEQGEAPIRGTYAISRSPEGLFEFRIHWENSEGESQQVYSVPGDAEAHPFAGGDLIDSMRLTIVSARELLLAGLWQGQERMLVQKQLDSGLQAMRVTQMVRLPMGDSLANVGVYRRNALA